MIRVVVSHEPIGMAAELAALEVGGVGGVASFTGIVRGDGGLVSLTLEHYPAMTDGALRTLAETAVQRWSLCAATIVHRVGTMVPGERIVFVGTAAAHRAAALDACAFLIDSLKTRAPFWKYEVFADGRAAWVEARESDNAAIERWATSTRGTDRTR